MNALDTAIYSMLSGGTALTTLVGGTASPRIYHLQAPEGSPLPYVVWNIQGGGDTNDSPHRVKSLVIFVRGFSSVSAKDAGSIDAQVDGLLHLKTLTVTGWTNIWLARETDLETVENPPSGAPVYMAGGLYRVNIEKT